jgi:hypothetical protein
LNDKLAEVISSSTTAYVAECYELYGLPVFGSMVRTADPPVEIYGVVGLAGTSSIEPGRRPIARGKDEASEQAVYESSPQLVKLLRSEFTVLVIGHAVEGKVFHYLPPKPARIHAFVYACTPDEVRMFGCSFDFLGGLVNAPPQVSVEELVAAVLREMSRVQDDPRAFLLAAGKALTALLGNDYNRLRNILTRLKVTGNG